MESLFIGRHVTLTRNKISVKGFRRMLHLFLLLQETHASMLSLHFGPGKVFREQTKDDGFRWIGERKRRRGHWKELSSSGLEPRIRRQVREIQKCHQHFEFRALILSFAPISAVGVAAAPNRIVVVRLALPSILTSNFILLRPC